MTMVSTGNNKGFTLIELLVVVSIIGLLSSIVLASLNDARVKALYTAAKVEIDQFVKASVIAQGEAGKVLKDITGSGYSAGSCPAGTDLKNISPSSSCYIRWVTSLTNVQNATNGIVEGITGMDRDPWGSPYILDENEHEGGPSDCRFDNIRTAGPDGIMYTGDDLSYTIPHYICP
jgi:prepilin-type N-terminal cleavage/methylation domain-containing protein